MPTPLENYNALIVNHPAIERKGKTTPYTSIHGHMFSFLSKEGEMGLRLSKEDRATFINLYDTQLMVQHGRVMKEYVKVPQTLLKDIDSLSIYFEKSFSYVSSLKPKPSRKKK